MYSTTPAEPPPGSDSQPAIQPTKGLRKWIERNEAYDLALKALYDALVKSKGEVTLAEAIDEVVLRTRQFAVRQERWFRRDPRIRWVDITTDPVAEVLPVVQEYFP